MFARLETVLLREIQNYKNRSRLNPLFNISPFKWSNFIKQSITFFISLNKNICLKIKRLYKEIIKKYNLKNYMIENQINYCLDVSLNTSLFLVTFIFYVWYIKKNTNSIDIGISFSLFENLFIKAFFGERGRIIV